MYETVAAVTAPHQVAQFVRPTMGAHELVMSVERSTAVHDPYLTPVLGSFHEGGGDGVEFSLEAVTLEAAALEWGALHLGNRQFSQSRTRSTNRLHRVLWSASRSVCVMRMSSRSH